MGKTYKDQKNWEHKHAGGRDEPAPVAKKGKKHKKFYENTEFHDEIYPGQFDYLDEE